MKITARLKIANQVWRFDPETGFLRCTAVIIQRGVMEYTRDEMGNPANVGTGALLRVCVPDEALWDQAARQSLEGVPCTAPNHVWQTTGTVQGSVGQIAGSPYYDGRSMIADILVTDAETVRRIMLPDGDEDKLCEISSAFDSQVVWKPGEMRDGPESSPAEPYDGYFSQIRYNHVAILPAGKARGGGTVRIVNTEKPEMQFVNVSINGRTVRVHNEDAEVAKEEDKKAKKSFDDVTAELAAANAALKAAQEARDKVAGEAEGYRKQLEAAMNGEEIEKAAKAMNAQREAAARVVNAHGLKLTDAEQKLHGHPLRLAVVNSIRTRNGGAALTDEQAKNESYVSGLFEALEFGAPKQATPPASVQAIPAAKVENADPKHDMGTAAGRLARLLG